MTHVRSVNKRASECVAEDVFQFSCAELYQVCRLSVRFWNLLPPQSVWVGVSSAINTKYINVFNKIHVHSQRLQGILWHMLAAARYIVAHLFLVVINY